jgi:Mg-chelatase subunit ChlD
MPESKPTPPKPAPQAQKPVSPQAQKPASPQPQAQPAAPKPERSATACPPPRKKWEAPELVILLDRSGSMQLRAHLPQSQIEDLYRRASRGDRAAIAKLNELTGNDSDSRLSVAKAAVRGMLETLPKDVDVGLVVFGKCSGAESFKFFSANDRPRMQALLQSITPQEGTPLARGLERAGAMVDGVSVPATVVVVTDGEDSCHGDPCAVARALKQAKPNLTINVVDVNGMGEGACMAQATGGKVFRMRSPDNLENLIKEASGEAPVPAGCQ